MASTKKDILTQKEIAVLDCLKDGMTNGQTAKKLKVCVSTVKFHITASIIKLEAENKINAVYKAFKYGLIK